MRASAILKAMPIVCAGVLCAACGDEATAPDGAPGDRRETAAAHAPLSAANSVTPMLDPFTARASIEPYFINQNPDLMFRSQVRADLAIQRLVTQPGGGGGWHTHPGPSFAIVEEGAVMITRYDPRKGCTATVYGPGQLAGKTYYEIAEEVHKATVVSAIPAVEYKVRFNVPAGAPFGTPETAEPNC